MNIPTITADPDEAERQFRLYDRLTQQRHDAELLAIRDGYRALADGHDLIDLHEVMREAGLDDDGYPALAIARSDTKFVNYRYQWTSEVGFGYQQLHTFTTDPSGVGAGRYLVGSVHLPGEVLPNPGWNKRGRAAVPVVPPELIPMTPQGQFANLKRFWTLFEAEWEPVPPVDPVLLRHIGGPLYAVIAEWDLTELERTVMRRRFIA